MVQYFDDFYMTDDQHEIRNKMHEVYELLQRACGEKDRSEAIMEKALQNSLNYAVFETNTGRLAGFMRVVTDYATVYNLCDVCIDEEFRERGIEEKMREWITHTEVKLKDLKNVSERFKEGEDKMEFRKMRRTKQEISKEECFQILRTEKRGALAVIGDGGYPYAIPLNFYFDETEEKMYFHCAKEGHKLDAIKNCDKVCFTVWNQGEQKDGDWSYYVTSVVIMGRAELVTDEKITYEKARELGRKYFPTEEEVNEELEKAVQRVQMVGIHIDHMTGKYVHER